ncbi:MAG: bifunctional diaminohydroxyphosphoribosylaminopyrimidine deaminase/5-amino-6-(5-phosphoribosylamino)uracil reductase RibD [Deltaproteobacteria bacterium]|nr:bifunctional diaminohydroxyphosphoribosylaminopyrimidine deaminase/5-amino-6-(5-phosphoribosylamino)uracil reductase RibD [Deltaproteobacteria bacterium]
MKVDHERFMREAIRLASKGFGLTSPNPPVGCVIVRGGEIVARGYHRRAGEPHAEIEALRRLGGRGRKGDRLYVTLEPCNHYGRTPPCTEAILGSGIRRVVVGTKDPNPKVAGGGCRFLAEKGVDVVSGVLESDCRRLIEVFAKHSTTGLPFVVAKSALTLDGWSATSTGHSRWVTGERSREFVHRLRERMDGVMVGVGTVLADDPSLTVRLGGRGKRHPARIIVDTRLRVPVHAKVIRDGLSATLIAIGSRVPAARRRALEREGVGVLVCPERNDRVDLPALMRRLGERSITSLLVEGGATLMGSMIRERLVDKFYIFKAPKVLGGGEGVPMASGPGPESMEGCIRLGDLVVRRFGEDVLFVGYPRYETEGAS